MATNSHVEPVETPTAGEQAVENVTTNMDLLRFATAGSVDDGKSTLIGRLLLDSKSIFEDQLEAVEATSKGKGYDYTDLAQPQVHHRRHSGPRAVHPQHGDRRLHR